LPFDVRGSGSNTSNSEVCERMKAMVLGVGAIGSVTADVLAKSDEFDKVILGARNVEKGKRLEKKISSDKVSVKKIDASDVSAMTKAFKGLDIVLNLVIPRYNFAIMEACEKAKVHYADTAWDIALDKTKPGQIVKPAPPSFRYLKRDKAWKKMGLTGMLGIGCDPGLTNIFARMGADRLDKVKDILIRDGDNGYVEGYEFAPLWSPETLIEEVLMPATYYANGHYRKYGSFENKEIFDFPDRVGKIPIYNVAHEEAETLPTYIGEVLGKGCDYCDFKIALGDEYVDAIKMIGKLGLGNPDKVDVKGVKVAPRDVVNAVLPDPSQLGHLSKGQCAIGAIVKGTKSGRKAGHYIWTSLDHKKTWDKYKNSATAWSVGVPIGIAAILFAKGKITQRGVFPPEMLDPKPFVKMLPKYGMNCKEKKL
jgi:saccharopine dehydrogenase (NAD+, L-lysine-forming)